MCLFSVATLNERAHPPLDAQHTNLCPQRFDAITIAHIFPKEQEEHNLKHRDNGLVNRIGRLG